MFYFAIVQSTGPTVRFKYLFSNIFTAKQVFLYGKHKI